MIEKLKESRKNGGRVRRVLLTWCALVIALATIVMIATGFWPTVRGASLHPLLVFIGSGIGASVLQSIWAFARWLSKSWRNVRRTLMGLACFATLVALLCTVEDWRGQRAWQNCKRELEANGAVLDWSAYTPAPVPDEQNIFKAPKMQEWFVGKGANELSQRLMTGPHGWDAAAAGTNAIGPIVAELSVAPANTQINPGDARTAIRLDDPAARAQVKKLIDAAVGPAATGPQDFTFIAKSLDQIVPVRMLLLTDKALTPQDVDQVFPDDTIAPASNWRMNAPRLRVEPAGPHSFRVSLDRGETYAASDYLAWSDQLEPDFSLIREALKRPSARMAGDYQSPVTQPIPNFVCIRELAQTLGQRAQCRLLLGQPEKAVDDLTLLQGIRGLLEATPSGKPMTLVAAMIDVAVIGIYVDTVAEGFRLKAWREPQLTALQQQLEQIRLLPLLAGGLRGEQVFACRTLENTSRTELKRLFCSSRDSLFDVEFLFFSFAPRGWLYQNMVTHARLLQRHFDGFDPVNEVILPHKQDALGGLIEKTFATLSPYTYIAGMTTANFFRAIQTVAHRQTRVNEALIACALERYRLAQGRYPETLEALVPTFAKHLPHDIIGGGPLKYRRTNDGRFVLYSVGWNETDDSAAAAPDLHLTQGDWVWPSSVE